MKLTESALLAGLPQAPSEYNPFPDPNQALKRRNNVLDNMAEQGYVDAGRVPARRNGSGLGPRAAATKYSRDPRALLLRLRRAGADRPLRRQHGAPGRPRGLHDDPAPAPDAAEQAIVTPRTRPTRRAAVVSTDVDTGEIVAMASSGGSSTVEQFNLAARADASRARRSRRSSLTTARSPGDRPRFDDLYLAPAQPRPARLRPTRRLRRPRGAHADASTTIAAATQASDNMVFALSSTSTSAPRTCTETAELTGIEAPGSRACPAEGIGGLWIGVTPLEMAAAHPRWPAAGPSCGNGRHQGGVPRRQGRHPGEGKEQRVFSDGARATATDILEPDSGGTGPRRTSGLPGGGQDRDDG